MNKFIALAALGLCFTSVYAKGPKKDKAEEGFVFTTVKEKKTRLLPSRTRTVPAHAGHSLPSVSWNQNCSVREKVNSTCLKCLLYTRPCRTVQPIMYVITETLLSLRAEALRMPYTVTKTTEWFRKTLCRVSHTAIHCLTTMNWML